MSAPPEVHTHAASYLDAGDGLSADRRETFALRLDRFWGDLRDAVVGVHPDPAVSGPLLERLVALAATAYAARPDDLHRLDLQRLLQPDWLQQPRMFGYACYAERFAGDLAGVAEHLDHLEDLGVTYLHLMPLLEPREGDNDGGYAVQDYRAVRSDLGTVDDLRDLATVLREHGISLVMDLVLNHVAREHDWAVRARAGDPAYRDYFHLFPDRHLPDAYEKTLPDVFPASAPGSFTHDPDLDAWVWTTFHHWQWDLDWSNPSVLAEFAEIILWLANLGVEVLRLDAIAFLWKRMGTTCQNQPEVHAITQALHTVTRIAAPAVAFKAEAIVGPRDLVQYLGSGDARRAGERPGVPQQPDGADLVDAGPRATSCSPARHSPPCHSRPRPAPGSPTCAATTTSAGRSTTATPGRWASPVRGTGASSPTGTPARRRARGPKGWSSKATRPPVTGGSADRPRRWPGCARTQRRPRSTPPWAGSSWRTRSPPGGAGCPWCGAATSWARPTTSPGPTSRATGTTTAGRTAHDSTGRSRPSVPISARCRAGSSAGSPTWRGCGPGCRSSTRRRPHTSYRTPTTGSWPPSGAIRAGSSSASTT